MKTIVILAGGKSSRMGTDKAFLEYEGNSFLIRMIEKAAPLFDQILISAGSVEHAAQIKRHLQEKQISPPLREMVRIIPDCYPGIGPMGGLLSVFEQTDAEACAVIAVDIPLADLRVCEKLLDLLPQSETMLDVSTCAVMLTWDEIHMESCAAAYHRNAYRQMKQAYEKGNYSLFQALGSKAILPCTPEQLKLAFPELADLDFPKAFQNVNTIEAFQTLL